MHTNCHFLHEHLTLHVSLRRYLLEHIGLHFQGHTLDNSVHTNCHFLHEHLTLHVSLRRYLLEHIGLHFQGHTLDNSVHTNCHFLGNSYYFEGSFHVFITTCKIRYYHRRDFHIRHIKRKRHTINHTLRGKNYSSDDVSLVNNLP